MHSIPLVINITRVVDINFVSFLKEFYSLSFLTPIINPNKNPYIIEDKIDNFATLSWVNNNNKNSKVIIAYIVIWTLRIFTFTLGFGHYNII